MRIVWSYIHESDRKIIYNVVLFIQNVRLILYPNGCNMTLFFIPKLLSNQSTRKWARSMKLHHKSMPRTIKIERIIPMSHYYALMEQIQSIWPKRADVWLKRPNLGHNIFQMLASHCQGLKPLDLNASLMWFQGFCPQPQPCKGYIPLAPSPS